MTFGSWLTEIVKESFSVQLFPEPVVFVTLTTYVVVELGDTDGFGSEKLPGVHK